jgi:hypothetical protein
MTPASSIEWVHLIFIIAILGFALWKAGWIRAILAVCLLIWGIFMVAYDIKIAAPLITIGALLFIQAILKLVTDYKDQAES